MVDAVVKDGVTPLTTVIGTDNTPDHSSTPALERVVPIAAWVAVPPVPPELTVKTMSALGTAIAGDVPVMVHAGYPLLRTTALRAYPV